MADENTVLVQAIRSFEGEEGDKGPTFPPFHVSRQRYADLKANGLVELVKSELEPAAEPEPLEPTQAKPKK